MTLLSILNTAAHSDCVASLKNRVADHWVLGKGQKTCDVEEDKRSEPPLAKARCIARGGSTVSVKVKAWKKDKTTFVYQTTVETDCPELSMFMETNNCKLTPIMRPFFAKLESSSKTNLPTSSNQPHSLLFSNTALASVSSAKESFKAGSDKLAAVAFGPNSTALEQSSEDASSILSDSSLESHSSASSVLTHFTGDDERDAYLQVVRRNTHLPALQLTQQNVANEGQNINHG